MRAAPPAPGPRAPAPPDRSRLMRVAARDLHVGDVALGSRQRVRAIYLSPAVREDASQEPHVYVYTGTSGDPNEDTPHQFYSVADFDEPPGAGADPFGRPDPSTHPEFWRE